jgi:hypothetical protein
MAGADTTPAGMKQLLREAMLAGQLVDWRTGNSRADDPSRGAGWDAKRTVAAGLLAELLTGTDGSQRPRALRLAGARILGQLDLEAAEVICPLLLRGCWFAEPIILDEAQAPAVRLPGCHLPGLNADQLTTRGNLQLSDGFTTRGEISLFGAHIGGQLDLSGATLTNPKGFALIGDTLTVERAMFCREGFAATGQVRLLGAHIGSQLDLSGATLTNPDGVALNADGLTVDQSMACGEGFAATGEVRLVGAHVGGSLDLSGAALTSREGVALFGDGLTVDQDMNRREGFTANGEVRLLGAHISGQLDLSRATFTNPDGIALSLQELRADALILRDLTQPPELVDFDYVHVGVLVDEPASWPRQAVLDGFAYEALYEDPPVSARQRLDWLARNPRGYSPQPYEQLAAVYRRAGRDNDARTVAIAKQRARRRTLALPGRLWSLLLDGLVGYGYRTWLAGVWLLVF